MKIIVMFSSTSETVSWPDVSEKKETLKFTTNILERVKNIHSQLKLSVKNNS